MFKYKILLITYCTDSFGNAFLKRFIDSDVKEISIFNRDEKNRMICERNGKISKLLFYQLILNWRIK